MRFMAHPFYVLLCFCVVSACFHIYSSNTRTSAFPIFITWFMGLSK